MDFTFSLDNQSLFEAMTILHVKVHGDWAEMATT